jgi:multidrug efflux pump subunit AcrA (membrane-fusion protein)
MAFAVIGLVVALVGALIGLAVCLARYAGQRKRFAAIVDVEAEATRLRTAAAQEAEAVQQATRRERDQQAALMHEAAQVRTEFERLSDELRKIEGNLEDVSFGLYRPQYRFDTPEQFKAELDRVYERQKEMIRAGKAASFAVSWTVGNSKRDGERMQKQYSKLLLRAFNGECDAAIAKVSWNNATKMEERIRRAFDAINQLGEVMTVSLAPGYRDLKLAELRLEYELVEKKREIAEEQRRIREQMRDEEKALREAERAQADAEEEEVRFQKALEKAKVELSRARGEEHVRLNAKLLELQGQLAEARAKSVRAKSLAEMTKAGYVYIISNIGSFGEQVFKIGMTRRLEPMDRVRELGAASVPFPFDVHAMVYSDDAPALEAAFHQRFKDRSVNLVNLRKEFFHVDLAELEAFAKQRGLKIAFTKVAEAREYRESAAMRLARGSGPTAAPNLQDQVAMGSALARLSRSSREDRPDVPRVQRDS